MMAMAALITAGSCTAQHNKPEIAGFSHPESVLRKGNDLYVSNIGAKLEPDRKDGDGFISKVDYSTGRITALHYLPASGSTLDAPKGSAFIGSVLYVADIDRVVGFDVDRREKVFELTIPGKPFLNDIVALHGKLIVSATDNGKLFEVDVAGNTATALPLPAIPGANGLCYDEATGKLYCVGLSSDGHSPDGKVYEVDGTTHKITVLGSYKGLLDGVALYRDKLYVSDWKAFDRSGVIMEIDIKIQTAQKMLAPGPIGGPADFTLSADGQYLIVPALLEGRLLFIPTAR